MLRTAACSPAPAGAGPDGLPGITQAPGHARRDGGVSDGPRTCMSGLPPERPSVGDGNAAQTDRAVALGDTDLLPACPRWCQARAPDRLIQIRYWSSSR